jgi:hypothetical protein
LGTSPKGQKIYQFEYIDMDKYGYGTFQGVMADEVPEEALIPQKMVCSQLITQN